MTSGTFTLLVVFVLGGFIVSKNDLEPWLKWAYYVSPMSYRQNAIAINEFLDERWSTLNTDRRFNETTVGKFLLQSRGFYTEDYMFWICVIALIGFSIVFNIFFIAALSFLNPFAESKTTTTMDENDSKQISYAFEGCYETIFDKL